MIVVTCRRIPETAPLGASSRIDLTCRRRASRGTCQDSPQSRQVLVYSCQPRNPHATIVAPTSCPAPRAESIFDTIAAAFAHE